MRAYLRVVVLLLFLPGLARAGTISAPKLAPGQYVYTIPANYDPPMIGRHGLQELQQQAKKLRYPFYVVIAKSIPGESDEDAAAAIDGLAEDWARDPRYNVGTSSIFLLSFFPRKYRVLAGLRWKNRLGLERDALLPYTAIFEESVQGTPKDPKTGIINLMRRFDWDVYDRTDPGRIAARQTAQRKAEAARKEAERKAAIIRQEEERKAAIAWKRHEARLRLDVEINRMETLTASASGLVDMDASYRSEMAKTAVIRRGTNSAEMNQQAMVLADMNNKLAAAVAEVQAIQAVKEARIHRVRQRRAAKGVGSIVLIGCLLLVLGVYTGTFVRRRRRFADQARQWRAKIAAAKQEYDRFYNEYTIYPHQPGISGETLELVTTLEVVATRLNLSLLSMERHIDECEISAKNVSFLQAGALQAALTRLTGEFSCNTAQIAATQVFTQDWPVLTLQPAAFMADIDHRFTALTKQWKEYQEDVAQRDIPAENLFGQAKLDELLQQADDHHIPHLWLDDHPLFGDAAADQALYAQVNDNRAQDPVGYAHKLQALREKETEVAGRLARVIAAIALVDGKRLAAAPAYDRTVLAPPDDPAVIFEQARHEDQRFAACVANRTPIEDLEAQASKTVQLYDQCTAQAEIVRKAIAEAAQAVQRAVALGQRVTGAGDQAAARVDHASRVHLHTAGPASLLQQGQHLLDASTQLVSEAQRQLEALSHLDALGSAQKAQAQLGQAEQAFNDCVRQCDELDEQKEAFERKLAQMQDAREDAARRIRGYGGSVGRLPDMPNIFVDDQPADFVVMLTALNQFENKINTEVRYARNEYEAEERRRREESMRSSMSSSSSFSSSSSSGSSISHSSSSSGGSIGGGSSSAGGSW